MTKIFTFKNKRTMPVWLAWILACLLKFLSLFIKVKFGGEPEYLEKYLVGPSHPCILAFWHNRLIFAPALFPKRLRHNIACLISASRDGEYISKIVRFFSLGVIRGSSSRGGLNALLLLKQSLHEKTTVMLTLDGPRGPMYCVHPGASALSQGTGVPVIPLVLNFNRYWKLKSWDQMKIPKPFSTATFMVGAPIFIPQGMPIEEANDLIHQSMMALTHD